MAGCGLQKNYGEKMSKPYFMEEKNLETLLSTLELDNERMNDVIKCIVDACKGKEFGKFESCIAMGIILTTVEADEGFRVEIESIRETNRGDA